MAVAVKRDGGQGGRNAFVTGVVRSVRGSLGRFLAIMGIVALGCGFYAGLQMSGPDMRRASDLLYDGTALWDLRVISTLGLEDADLDRLAKLDGVLAVMPSQTCDAMARLGDEQIAVRISSLDVEAAQDSSQISITQVASDRDAYLNRPMLVEGRWPSKAGECVIGADKPVGSFGVGDTMTILGGGDTLDDMLESRELTVVGTVGSSSYPYTGSFGSTTLGTGMIGQYVYVSADSMKEDAPYTEAYLAVDGARDELSESDGYYQVVDPVKERIEDEADQLSRQRLADLKAKAQEELDEKWDEYHEEYDKAYDQLADAKAELDDARAQIDDGRQQLAEGIAEYEDGRAEYEDGVAQLADGERTWQDGLDQLRSQLADAGVTGSTAQELRNALAAKLDEANDGRAQLVDGIAQVDDGLAQTEDGLKQLDEGIAQVDDGLAQANEGKAQLDDGIAQVDDGLAQATEGRAQLEDGLSQLDEGLAQATEGKAQLEDGLSQLDEGLAQARAGESQLIEGLAQADAAIAQLEQKRQAVGLTDEEEALLAQLTAQRAEAQAQLEAVQGQIAQLEAQRGELGATLAQTEVTIQQLETQQAALAQQLDQVVAQIDELQQTRAGLVEQRSQVVATISELKRTKAELVEQRAKVQETQVALRGTKSSLTRQLAELDGQLPGLREALAGVDELVSSRQTLDQSAAQLADAQAELDSAWQQIVDSQAELDDAQAQYDDGLAEWTDARREADDEFADARQQLQDAQRDINELECGDLYVLDRSQSEGAATYHADSERIDSIADVFPFMFFLVAALVALTTMTRMVEDERQEIGTYKALGYGTAQIASRYLAYAAIAGSVGAVVGIGVLSQILPFIIMSAYSIIYTFPPLALPLPIDLGISLSAGGLGVGVTLLATWFAVVASLREAPATLMLPRAPAAGKRILLERVGPVWRRMSFSWKVTCRNLFRYKRRFFMTVVGISGCTALLLTGFGLHDSIWDIIDRQYGPIVHFDTTVGLSDGSTSLDVQRVASFLEGTGEVSDLVRIQQENMRAGGTGVSTSATSTTHVGVVIPRDADRMGLALTFQRRSDGAAVPFDDNAVLVTEKLASLHGIQPGGQIVLYDQDDVGNAVGEGHHLTVTGVVENYVGNVVYVGRTAWKQVSQDALPFSTIYCRTNEDPSVRQQISDALHEQRDVSTVVYSDVTINMYRNMLSVVDMVVVVLIVSAGALAFIVLYNLTNINIGERVREIASLKVLGFTKGEVYAYIFREIAILAVIGDIAGMVLGTVLERFVVTTAEVDYVMFGRSIHPTSYVWSFALTLVFTGLILLLMRHKLDRVNMVESLKSVD